MRHPFLQNVRSISIYAFVWVVISAAHTAALMYLYAFPLERCFADALISNGLFALLALSFWYTVRFISIDTGMPFIILFNHSVAALVFLAMWHYVSYGLLHWAADGDESYILLLKGSVVWRCLIGLFYYCILVLIYYLYLYYSSFQKKIQREGTLHTLIKEGELSLLKSQLQPHFIFNSLNSIHSLSISDPDAARIMLLNLSSFLRLSMEKDRTELVSLREETEHALLYLHIEKVRFGKRLDIQMVTEEATLTKTIPHLILQPLVENAVKHGLHQHTGTVTLCIEASMKDSDLVIRISNTHDSGMPKTPGAGIGLANVHRRLLLTYNRKDLMQIRHENGIFLVELIIPQR